MTSPADWELTTLGQLGRYINGRGFKKTEWRTEGRPIVRIQNLTGSSHTFNYFDGEADERHVVRTGDLLVSWAATLGSYFWNGPEAVLNQHIFKVESYIDPTFHKYLLDQKFDELMRHTHGSGMVHITRGAFESIPVAVPPLDEQRRIVAILEEHLSRLDAADAYLNASAARTNAWRSKVVNELLWADEYPRVPIEDLLRERMRNGRSDRAVKGEASGTRALTLTAVTKNAFTEENTKITITTPERAEGLWLEPGDILVQRSNTPELVGTSARYDGPMDWAIFPDLMIRLRPDETRVDGRFLAAALQSELGHRQLRRKARGASGSMPKIDQGAISSALMPVPSLDLQRDLLAKVEAVNDASSRLQTELAGAKAKGKALRDRLLTAAFSGHLTSASKVPEIEEMLLA